LLLRATERKPLSARFVERLLPKGTFAQRAGASGGGPTAGRPEWEPQGYLAGWVTVVSRRPRPVEPTVVWPLGWTARLAYLSTVSIGRVVTV